MSRWSRRRAWPDCPTSDPAEYLAGPDPNLDAFRADHGLPLVTARLEHAIAQQGDAIQWIEGRLAALRSIARYVATYPPDFAARQVAGVATALSLDPSTVTAEFADAYLPAAHATIPSH